MTDTDDYKTCDHCGKTILPTDLHCSTADVLFLCEEHAYSLSDAIAQHEEILAMKEWSCGDLDYESREEMEAALAKMKNDLAANGDRKLVWADEVAA